MTIVFAGENTYKMHVINAAISRRNNCLLDRLSPTPSPRVSENVKRIFTIGLNITINLSSPLRNLSKAFACFRNTSKIGSGEL